MKKVRSTDMAIIHINDVTQDIVMLDIVNRRIIKRKMQYIGEPVVRAVIYQGNHHFTCNMGSVSYGEIRY